MDYPIPIIVGFTVGFLIGLTGMGGGALMTPFLILWVKLNPVTAVATDLMFAAITKLFGSVQHRRHGNVSLRNVAWMATGSLPATVLASRFVLTHTGDTHLVEVVLPRFLGVVLLLVGLIMLARSLKWLLPRHGAPIKEPPWLLLAGIGAVGGTLVGLTSVGGGTIIMALLLLLSTMPLSSMIGLDVAHGALLTTTAAATYMASGRTMWSIVGLLLIGSIPGVWLGAKATKRFDPEWIRRILALLILGAAIDLLRG